jgi:hypothetical protein
VPFLVFLSYHRVQDSGLFHHLIITFAMYGYFVVIVMTMIDDHYLLVFDFLSVVVGAVASSATGSGTSLRFFCFLLASSTTAVVVFVSVTGATEAGAGVAGVAGVAMAAVFAGTPTGTVFLPLNNLP